MMKEKEKNNNRKKEMMTRVELKNMHSTELRKLKKMIQEELNFREDIGKEIETIKTKGKDTNRHDKD